MSNLCTFQSTRVQSLCTLWRWLKMIHSCKMWQNTMAIFIPNENWPHKIDGQVHATFMFFVTFMLLSLEMPRDSNKINTPINLNALGLMRFIDNIDHIKNCNQIYLFKVVKAICRSTPFFLHRRQLHFFVVVYVSFWPD